MNGGAVSADGGDFAATDCEFVGNTSEKHAAGLGALSNAEVLLTRCRFRANDTNDLGGALFIDRSTLLAVDCEMAGNVARLGGALFSMRDATLELISSTVASNQARELGGGIYLRDSAAARFEQTILWSNCESNQENDAVLEGPDTRLSFFCSALRPDAIDGADEAIEYEGAQVLEDPKFCAPSPCPDAPTAGGDYGIETGSSCDPERSPCGLRIGSGQINCGVTPIREMSWGSLKARWSKATTTDDGPTREDVNTR